MSGLLRLAASGVQIGVALPWSVRNASGMLLLARGFDIEEEEQLRQLLERGAYVDAVEAHYVARSEAAKAVAAVPRALGLFEEWSSIYRRLEAPLKNAGTKSQFLPLIETLARDIVTLIERDVDVSIYTFVRQENIQFFNYGFTHSVHTAIAGVLMARRLGWPAARILVLAQAAP